jgi:hypothetical protein
MLQGRWLWGTPNQLLPLGQVTFRYRGQVAFQVKRTGGFWFCHEGFQVPPDLSQRRFNRDCGLSANDPGMFSTMSEDGWGSFTKNGCLRKVCRAIDSELKNSMREDAAYLERKGVLA